MASPSLLIAQPDDKAALLNFMVPLQVLTDTDEGSQKDSAYRLKKIGWYNNAETAFFALPSSSSASVECLEGDCMNGLGTARYTSVDATYFRDF